MSKNLVTKISVTLNIIFFIIICLLVYKLKDKLLNKFSGKNATIVMFGDSLTENGEWDDLLSRNDVANEGTGGFTTSHFVWQVPKSVLQRQPKICFIEGGTNDVGVGISYNRTVENIEKIVDTLTSHQIIPVLTLTVYTSHDTLKNAKIDSLNTMLKQLAQKKQIEYFDLNDKLSSNGFLKKEFTVDGTHLTKIAYPVWAEKVKAIIAKHKI